ncbi:MAG: NmrA family NAD(P)-binding protein [Burkholderiales bacterium]
MACLVVGATGVVGGQIALGLRERSAPVRALVRGASHPKRQALTDAGIEIAEGDLTLPETLDAACRGAEVVITTATSMPTGANDGLRRVDLEGTMALIAAAERARVRKFVYVSYSGNLNEPSPLGLAKRSCEVRLKDSPMQTVILRPSFFTEVWIGPALGFDVRNGKARIYGPGTAKVSYISAFDVAAFGVAAATQDQEAKTTVLELGGPDALSQLDVVAIFQQAPGRTMALEFVPIEALQAQVGAPDPLQATFAALTLAYAKGDMIEDANGVAERHGVKLRSVAQFASEVAARQSSNAG